MDQKVTSKTVDKLMKVNNWSKKRIGVCANHPDCHNQRGYRSKFCDECSTDYYNEHKDD